MDKKEYLDLRNGLYTAAEGLINEGKLEEANEKMGEISSLDNKFETEATAMANLNALKDNSKVTNLNNFSNVLLAATPIAKMGQCDTDNDVLNSMEYRKAFMNYVATGTQINKELFNADQTTKTSDVGEMIPTTVLEKIIEKLEATGMILPLITRTSVKGGMTIPTSTIKPVATWVLQGAGSEKQKKTTGSVTFAYHKLRCAVAVTFETDLMSLSMFENAIINNITEAMIKALEQSIISGTGTGTPKGILSETAPTGQELTASTIDYDLLIKAEAALPIEYENNAVYCMTKKTFMGYQNIKDTAGQPIARINYGITGKPERTLLGRKVVLCNYLDTFSSTLEAGKIFAFLFDFKDYVLNTNYNMGIKKYDDNDTDDKITRAIMIADGKVVDTSSLVTIAKKE